MSKWVIFDMDNTLINTEPLYLNAIEEFLGLMTIWGFPKEQVAKRQAAIDAGLLSKMGYSTDRFAESFEQTFKEFKSNRHQYDDDELWKESRIAEMIGIVRSIAMDVFNKKSLEYEYAMTAVRDIVAQGYKVAVITAGERWVQLKRFDDLTMRNLFHDCWVVLHKDAQVFKDFCAKHKVDSAYSWMIGDSLKSDILPAVEAGLSAIHLQTSNWQARDGESKLPNGAVSVKDLSYAPSIIQTITKYGWQYANGARA